MSHDYEEDNSDIEDIISSTDDINKLDLNYKTYDENSHVHFLPAKIIYNGKCNVDKYFTPLIIENKENLASSFRGRKLNGLKKNVNGYNFFYAKFFRRSSKKRVDRVLNIKKFSVWKYDEKIENNNTFINIEEILNDLNILK